MGGRGAGICKLRGVGGLIVRQEEGKEASGLGLKVHAD